MQVLDNLFDLIGPSQQSAIQATAENLGEEGEQQLETEEFLALLSQHLLALGTINGKPATTGEGEIGETGSIDGLAEMFAGQQGISAEISALNQTLSHRGLLQVSTDGEASDLGEQVSTLLNQIFQDALEQPIEQPFGFTQEDLDILRAMDPAQLAQDLDGLKQLATAVTLENGTPLTEEEFLSILQSELSPALGGISLDADVEALEDDEGEGQLLSLGEDDAEDTAEENAVASSAAGASQPQADDAVDAEVIARQRLVAEDNLQDRKAARDARLTAALGNDSDGDAEAFAAPNAATLPANANGSTGSGPINLAATAQLASLNGPGGPAGQGANGQPGFGRGGDNPGGGLFAAANAEEAAQAASTTTQQSTNQANFQSMVANTTPSRAPMSPATMQVSLQVSQAAKAGQSQLRIQLSPAELGTIDVELNFDGDGNVTGKLIAEKAETLDMLRNDSRTLEKALEDAGLTLGSDGLEFSLRDGGEGDANPQFAGNGSGNAGEGGEDNGDAAEWQHVDIITEDQVDVQV